MNKICKKILNNYKNKIGFTLAEAMVALVIVGIVAVLTIPSMIINTNDKENAHTFKKIYLDFAQAADQIIDDNGGDMVNAFTSDNNTMDTFCNKMNCIKKCYAGQNPGVCFHSGTSWKTLQGTSGWATFDPDPRFILSNGALVVLDLYGGSCTSAGIVRNGIDLNIVCGFMYIDVNGFKPPNSAGRDIFGFFMAQDGIYPLGSGDSALANTTVFCNVSSNDVGNGNGCSASVLQGKYYPYN